MERACFYARVSTEEEKQANALVKQCEEARQAIANNGWTLMPQCEYIDEGKTGTTTNRRFAYNKLCEDMSRDLFDIIVIKSQDRLMRSAKEWYLFLGKLLDSGKRLYMYLDNKFYEPDDALITGIKAILAEEYSRDLSKKINNANKHRQSSGSSVITNGRLWGYEQKDGELYVVEDEAIIIRKIFDLYIAGNGVRRIKQILDKDGVVSRHGTQIGLTTLKRMIKNPVYIGTIVQNKKHYEFNTKRIVSNPEEEWICHENRVPAIVDEKTWQKANEIMNRRKIEMPRESMLGINRGSYPLSGKIFCSLCGSKYRRTKYTQNGVTTIYWICGTYQEKGRLHPKGKPAKEQGCDGKNIKESVLLDAIRQISKENYVDIERGINLAIEALRKSIGKTRITESVESLTVKKKALMSQQEILLDKLLEGVITDQVYAAKQKEIENKLTALEIKITEAENIDTRQAENEKRLNELIAYVKSDLMEEQTRMKMLLDNVERIDMFDDHADITINLIGKYRTTFIDSKCDQCQTG